ncbi:hypothetical protein FGE12_14325 [Aggregicoccus sp. 17bor-14]|nr:hypothetical protein [Simulacricoccus sp. 17bor-14]MRI89328.1 hypothetical protein [Aggregicoccus sp. 17bor-14]
MSSPLPDSCPRCEAPRAAGPECPRCGVLYARARPRPAAPPTDTEPEPAWALRPPTPAWEGELEAQRWELGVRALALPVALLLAFLVQGTQLGRSLVRIFFGMWLHELGHAVTAWLCGFSAVPGFWFTSIADERSVVVSLVIAAALAYAGWRLWRAHGPLSAAPLGVLLLVQAVCTLGLSASRAQGLILFGGDAGDLVLGSLLMATLYAPEASRLRTASLRWGFLAIGAFGFMDAAEQWWAAVRDPERIPYGLQEGVGLSDPSRLTEDLGWTQGALVGRYVTLSGVCLAALALLYVWGLAQQRRRVASTGR